jgi:RND family efflux transporter MFP subunit
MKTLLLGFAALSGLAVVGCAPQTSAQAPAAAPAPIVPVQVVTPEKRDVSRMLTLPGDIIAGEQATLNAKVPGYLDQVLVREGDSVRAGQLLAVLRAPELDAEKRQAEQTLGALQASAKGSEATRQRTGLETRRTRLQVDKARAELTQAEADQSRSEALVKQAVGAIQEAKTQATQAKSAIEESRALVAKAESEKEATQAELELAEATFGRLDGIYQKDKRLIAAQDVDTAKSKRDAARSRVVAAGSQLQAARARVETAQQQAEGAGQRVPQLEASAEASEAQVRSTKAKVQALREQLKVAQAEVELGKGQEQVASAKAQESRFQIGAGAGAVEKLSVQAEYRQIRAPFNGVVVQRHADPGTLIQANPVLTVATTNTVRIRFYVPESETDLVKAGTAVKIEARNLAEPVTGRVSRTATALDPRTRTLLVEVDLSNTTKALFSGTYATVKLTLETHPQVIALPSAAIGSDKSGKFVFIDDGGKAKRVPIRVGFEDGKFTEVSEGLKGDETVVVTGRDLLAGGTKLETTPWTPPTPAPKTR